MPTNPLDALGSNMPSADSLIPPDAIETVPPVLAGDWLDDDAAYLDALIEPDADPPTPEELPKTAEHSPLPKPETPQNNRIIALTYTLPRASASVQMLPADPRRATITVQSAKGGCYISSQPFPTPNDGASGTLTHTAHLGYWLAEGASALTLDYQGELWVTPYYDEVKNYTVSVMAVTE